ncbi:cytochrome P450 [Lyophyllum atratum]|nr:cytochrome P450 [Lyophyllum atratum]
MSPPITQLVLALCLSWAFWRYFRPFIVKTDLDNIPGPPSSSFLKGNFEQLFNTNGWEFHKQISQKFGKIVLLKGLFGKRQLFVFDPKALHHILVKDQDIFEETDAFFATNDLLFGAGLLTTHGERHRKQRKMLNPVFSVNHMRYMIPLFYNVANKMHTTIAHHLANGSREVDILQWMTRAALEMIGQSGLGYSFDPLDEGEAEHPYSKSVKDLMPAMFTLAFPRVVLLPLLVKIGTPSFRRSIMELLPFKNLHRVKDIVDIMEKTSVDILDGKKRALEEGDTAVMNQIGQGKDIMSILMKANLEASECDRLEDKEVLGQVSALIFAAMDTTSNALSRILYLLATHPGTQERLRTEVLDAREKHGDVPHDELIALPLLDAICRETLRLYPPVSLVVRRARQDAVLPLSTPLRGIDGREMKELAVPKNTDVFVSILSSNRDPTLWGDDSYKWKPERWLSPLPDEVVNAHLPGVYSHLLTFIGGGRACIGFKFSQLEMKVVLSVLVSKFRLHPPKEEIVWEMGVIAVPTVKGKPGKPCLPLRLELLA